MAHDREFEIPDDAVPGKYVSRITEAGFAVLGPSKRVSMGTFEMNLEIVTIKEDGTRSTSTNILLYLADIRRDFKRHPNVHRTCFEYLRELRG